MNATNPVRETVQTMSGMTEMHPTTHPTHEGEDKELDSFELFGSELFGSELFGSDFDALDTLVELVDTDDKVVDELFELDYVEQDLSELQKLFSQESNSSESVDLTQSDKEEYELLSQFNPALTEPGPICVDVDSVFRQLGYDADSNALDSDVLDSDVLDSDAQNSEPPRKKRRTRKLTRKKYSSYKKRSPSKPPPHIILLHAWK